MINSKKVAPIELITGLEKDREDLIKESILFKKEFKILSSED